MKKKERMEKEIRELKVSLETRQTEIKAKQQEVLESQEHVEKLEHQLREQKQLVDKVQKEFDAVNQKVLEMKFG
jgi:chromosome segregation ATPase